MARVFDTLIAFCVILTQITNSRILRHLPNYVTAPAKKHESILYSCFINNAETEIIIHDGIPQHFKNNNNIDSLHEGLSLSISTFSCYQYTHLNITFSLKLFQNLYAKDGGFKIYKNGKVQPKPNSKQYYRSFLGDVAVFEYTDQSSSATKIRPGKAALTFLGNISIFNDEKKSDHPSLYKCQSFSAQIWTVNYIYEINPIPTTKSSSPTCDSMTLSVIPTNKLHEFSQNLFLNQFMKNNIDTEKKNNNRKLLENDYSINKFDCSSWDDQWRHHHSVKIGLVIDQSFYDKFENSDDLLDEYIALIFTNTNGIFEPQLNVHVSIGDVFVAENIPNYSSLSSQMKWWMDTECVLQNEQFTVMKGWNSAKWAHDEQNCTDMGYDYSTFSSCPYIDTHASWILLSNCHPGAGSATRVKLCQIDGANVATVNYHMDVTWLVFAHELGHLFGSVHFYDNGQGGIMDYGDKKYEGIHQFRMEIDICWGIQQSRTNDPLNYKPNCWQTYDYGSLNYEWWRQTGNYSQCYPSCGKYQFKVEIIECVSTAGDVIVGDTNCGLELKPYGKFIECEQDELVGECTSVCGNGLWEVNEECDTQLLDDNDVRNECCPPENDCKRSTTTQCLRLKKQIDAGFTDNNGKLYLFQGCQYAVYSNIDGNFGSIGTPDIGYPKYILTSFPTKSWNCDFDATFATFDNIVYIFKDFKYIRIDLNAINIETGNAQIDVEPITIEVESETFEFGYIPQTFSDCGHIDAAFIHSVHTATIICDTISYSWNIGENINSAFQNIYRPFFSDYNVKFGDFYASYHHIDAASYNISTQITRFYGADVYVDYINGKQYGDENKLPSMGYWADNANCGADNCGNCDVVHNDKCYDSSFLMVIQFESIEFDAEHFDLDSIQNIQYDANGGVFSGTNAVQFTANSRIQLKVHPSPYSAILNWRMSIWLYPTTNKKEQSFFHIIDKDTSHTILMLNGGNSQCSNSINQQLTITVKHTNTISGEIIIFEDTDCIIPLQLNEWSKLTFDAVPSMIAITVNSKTQTSNIIESEIDLTIDFESWHLGHDYIGKMDYFVFQETDGEITFIEPTIQPTSPPDAAACTFPFVSNIAEMIAWISACLALYTVGMWVVYKYYGARVLLNHIARQLNVQHQQPFDPENNHGGAGNDNDVEMMVVNQPQQVVQEAAAGMAIQAIEQVLSGNVTPNFLSPKGKGGHADDEPALSRHLLSTDNPIVSPRGIRYTQDENEQQYGGGNDDQQYHGNFLVSPARKWHK